MWCLTLKLLPSCLKYVSGPLPASWKTPWDWPNKEVGGGRSTLPARAAGPACVCVRARDKLKQAKGHHLHCSAMNNSSGSQTQRCYTPSLPSNRGGVCVRKERGQGGQQRWRSERWGSGMSLALCNIMQRKQIFLAGQQVASGPFHHSKQQTVNTTGKICNHTAQHYQPESKEREKKVRGHW